MNRRLITTDPLKNIKNGKEDGDYRFSVDMSTGEISKYMHMDFLIYNINCYERREDAEDCSKAIKEKRKNGKLK